MPADQLFAPFTRGVTESSISGMGLGLALAQRIVQAHGGSLTASAASPAADVPGTAFTICLPVLPQPRLDE